MLSDCRFWTTYGLISNLGQNHGVVVVGDTSVFLLDEALVFASFLGSHKFSSYLQVFWGPTIPSRAEKVLGE
jgi:L-fucose isomerase-like protein